MDPIATFFAAVAALSSGISSMPVPAALVPQVHADAAVPQILTTLPADAQRIADRSRIIAILKGENTTVGGRTRLSVAPDLSVSGTDSCHTFSGRMFVSEQGQIDLSTVRTTQVCPPSVDDQFWTVMGKPMVLFVDPRNQMYLTSGADTLPLVKR